MSSKYSEFRKTKQTQTKIHKISHRTNNDMFNLQEIDQMMYVLTQPLNLGTKQGSFTSRKQDRKSQLQNYQDECDSRKGSELNQTCDLTTNVDSQSMSRQQKEKLPQLTKNINRRHYTQHEIASEQSQIQQQNLNKTGYELQKNQLLLEDDIEQYEQIDNQSLTQQQKAKIFAKLHSLQQKLKVKKINLTETTIILEKLEKLELLISQV